MFSKYHADLLYIHQPITTKHTEKKRYVKKKTKPMTPHYTQYIIELFNPYIYFARCKQKQKYSTDTSIEKQIDYTTSTSYFPAMINKSALVHPHKKKKLMQTIVQKKCTLTTKAEPFANLSSAGNPPGSLIRNK